MKYFQIAILLFIFSFDVFAVAEDYLEKKQLTDKQVIDIDKNLSDNEIEMDDEFNKIVQSITNLDTWKSINQENAHNVEIILQKEINEISKKMTDNVKFAKKFQEDESKIWLKYFLEKLYNSLSDYVTQLNKDWNSEYLDLVQHYNTLQMEVESFKETVNNFNFALNSLKNTKYRSKVIKDVYKQNLMGIPTTFVILGMREWQPSMETKDQCYKIIKENAKHFIGEQLAPTALIFSEQTVKKAKVTVDIIKRYRGGVIEPFETDPIAFQHYKVSYVIQKYRCYPKLDSFEGNNHNHSNIKGNLADNEPIFYHLTSDKLHELIADNTLPKKHLDKIKLMLDESDKKNKSSISNIMSFNYQYMDQIQKIEKPYNDNVENINSLLNKIVNIINKHKNETSINNNISISEFQSNVRKLVHLDDTLIEKENEYRKPINEMLNQIQKKSFQSLSDKAKARFYQKIKERRMIIFTNRQEFIQSKQSLEKLNLQLLDGALDELKNRQKKLIKYDLIVIQNKKLKSITATQYYNEGRVTRYFLMPPILTFIGSDTSVLSLFLAQEIYFNERQEGQKQIITQLKAPVVLDKKSTKEKQLNTIYTDAQYSWYVHQSLKCMTYQDAKSVLPTGYYIPDRKQMELFYIFMQKNQKVNKIKMLLSQPVTYAWTDEQHDIMNDYWNINLKTGNGKYRAEDSCALLIGVKRQ